MLFPLNNKVLPIILFAMCMSILSCKKFLDKKPSNAITSPTRIADLQALLDDASIMNQLRTPSAGEAASDDYHLVPGIYTKMLAAYSGNLIEPAYTWRPYELLYGNDWSINYMPVYNANYCLDMIGDIPSDESDHWKNVYGSALFYRAYYFLQLCWVYGKAYDSETYNKDLGIVLRLSSDFNIPSKRATVKESYDQVIMDAKKSVDYLPDFPLHVYRPSKWAAYGLLARAYLSMREYDSAYKYADQCLKLKEDLINFNGDDDLLGLTKRSPFKRFNKETIFYTEMNTAALYILVYPEYIAIDSILLSQYKEGDLRRKGYFSGNSGFYNFKGSYTQSANYFTGLAVDEIMLIRSEAAARINKGSATILRALNDINKLLSNRFDQSYFTAIENLTQGQIIDAIVKERRKELLFRGIRWIDIKRLNKEGKNIVLRRVLDDGSEYELQPNSNYYALPLPIDIIKSTGMQQN